MRPTGPQSQPRPTRVIEVEALSRSMQRIRLQGEDLQNLQVIPGQQFRVEVPGSPETDDQPVYRTYSMWRYDPAAGWLDLVVYLHLNGPGSRWARDAQVGQELDVFGPVGAYVVDRKARHHLFLGEETAAVAIQAMLQDLPEDAEARVLLEADGPEDALPAVSRFEEGAWVFREGAPAGPEGPLLEALQALELPEEPGVAYVAGELRTCMALRDHLLKERGWKRRDVRVKPFWAPDKVGLT